jgi:hypothetical protein
MRPPAATQSLVAGIERRWNQDFAAQSRLYGMTGTTLAVTSDEVSDPATYDSKQTSNGPALKLTGSEC